MTSLIKKYWVVGIQGFLSGLPFAAITSALQAQYIDANASALLIGSLSLLGQIYVVKFLLAPLADNLTPPFLSQEINRNQAWILLSQTALVLALLAMASLSAQKTPFLIISIAFLISFFSAFQDVNIDSYRIKLLKPNELAQGSTYYLLGFRIGMLFSGGLCIVVGHKLNWHFAYALLAIMMLIGMLLTRQTESIKNKPEKKEKLYQTFYHAYFDLKHRPLILTTCCFIILYGLGDAFTISVNNMFLIREMHLTLSELAFYANTLNIMMLIFSTISARFCFKHFNQTTCLIGFSIAQIVMLAMYMLLANIGPNKWLIISAILSEGLAGGLIASAIIVVISQITREPFTTTQYAILSALATLKNIFLGPLAAVIVKHTSWSHLYLLGILLSLPGTYLAWYLNEYWYGTKLPDAQAA